MKKISLLILILCVILSCSSLSFAASSFYDIEDTKYETAVNSLASLEIVSGYPDGTYKPNAIVSRSELAKLLIISYGLEKDAKANTKKTSFSDVNSHWASGYINISSSQKFITGYPDGTFKPDDAVTYAEAITMCVRVLGYSKAAELNGSWPTNYINAAQDLRLTKNIKINSYNDLATRGDTAILIWNMLNIKLFGKTGSKKTLLDINFLDKLEDSEDTNMIAIKISASNSNNFLTEDGETEIEDENGKLIYYIESDNKNIPLLEYKNGVIVYTTKTSMEEDGRVIKKMKLQSSLKLDEIKELQNSKSNSVIKEVDNDKVIDYNGDTMLLLYDKATSKQDKKYRDYLFVIITVDTEESNKNYIEDLDYIMYEDAILDEDIFEKNTVLIDDSQNEVMYIVKGFKFNASQLLKPENDEPENNESENNKPENSTPENNKPENNKPENNQPENNQPENNKPENNEPEKVLETVTLSLNKYNDKVNLSSKEYVINYTCTPGNAKVIFELENNQTEARIENNKIIFSKTGTINVIIKLNSDGYAQPKGTVLAKFLLTVAEDPVPQKVTDYIFTGDSRFVQMHNAVNSKDTKHWLNKGGEGYSWINSNKSKLTAKVIIWNWGVNDGLYDTSNRNKVIKNYKTLLTSLAKTHTIYVVSVNPLGSAYTSKHTLNNSHIKAFNSAMKEFCDTNDNLIYIDTYNKFYNDFIKNTSDGLHYNNAMSKKLYNYLCEQVGIT